MDSLGSVRKIPLSAPIANFVLLDLRHVYMWYSCLSALSVNRPGDGILPTNGFLPQFRMQLYPLEQICCCIGSSSPEQN